MSGFELNGVGPNGDRDEQTNAGEYRDEQLSRAFDADLVPQHGSDFWSNLQVNLGVETPGLTTGSTTGSTTVSEQPTGQAPDRGRTDDSTTPLQLLDHHGPGTDDAELLSVRPIDRRRRAALPMLIAAAMIAVVGLGVVALVIAANNQTTVDTGPATADVSVGDEERSPDTTAQPGDREPDDQSGKASAGDPDAVQPLRADYFSDPQAVSIGSGQIVGFSADESSVLLVDETSGPELGCEGAPMLELWTQDLAGGVRYNQDVPVQTGGLEVTAIENNGDGSQTLTWVDFCDGAISSAKTGQLAADGQLDQVEEIDANSQSSSFDSSEVVSPDGSTVLTLDGGPARVRLVDGDENSSEQTTEWALDLPDIRGGGGSFDPTGQVVAIPGADVVHLWLFRTDRLVTVPVVGAYDTGFSASGELLRVSSFDETRGATVVVFDGDQRPIQPLVDGAETTVVCSGTVELAPLSPDDLVAAGLSPAAAETAMVIDSAAAQCDWESLTTLAGDDFTASLGGGGVELLIESEEAGTDTLRTLRVLLRQPFGSQQPAGDPGALYVWPAAFLRDSCDAFTDEDRASLLELGYSEDDIARDCDALGGYAGWRVGIDADGNWLYFVAGD